MIEHWESKGDAPLCSALSPTNGGNPALKRRRLPDLEPGDKMLPPSPQNHSSNILLLFPCMLKGALGDNTEMEEEESLS